MANLAQERYIKKVGDTTPSLLQIGVTGETPKIWEGAMVASAAGFATRAGESGSGHAIGVAQETVDNSAVGAADGDKSINVMQGAFWFGNSAAADEVTEADFLATVFIVDDQTVALTDDTGARAIAGQALRVDSVLGVLVYIDALNNANLAAIAAAAAA